MTSHRRRNKRWHFLKRLHERFGIGATDALYWAITQVIAHQDYTRCRYAGKRLGSTQGRSEYWLVDIAGRYVAVIYSPSSGVVESCWYATASLQVFEVKQQVISEGGLVPFWEGVNKIPLTNNGKGRRGVLG